jgi:hypothetical protein
MTLGFELHYIRVARVNYLSLNRVFHTVSPNLHLIKRAEAATGFCLVAASTRVKRITLESAGKVFYTRLRLK